MIKNKLDLMPKIFIGAVAFMIVISAIVYSIFGAETELYFNDRLYQKEQLEEILADLIEAENPELDIEVIINVEVDD